MANAFLKRLQDGNVLVADGATGTNLQKVGLIGGTPTEAWVLEQPEKILHLESAFIAAGADIILTCTFGGTRLRLKDSPYVKRVVEINHKAAELAHQAAQAHPKTLVAGSIGPTGLLLKPYGPWTIEEASLAYAEQAKALTEGGVDLLVIETHFALEEAKAALEGVRKVSDLPTVVSFSFDRGLRTMMGVKPSQVVQAFQPLGVAAVGANCGTTLENMETIIKEYATLAPGLILWVKPNAGMPVVNEDGMTSYNVTPEQMGEYARRYVQIGARVVGGCCGSTPEHIGAIAKAVKKVLSD